MKDIIENQEYSYKEWFMIFKDECRQLDYTGTFKGKKARMLYEDGLSPSDAAFAYVF